MQRGRQLYEGKAKVLFESDHPGQLIQYFKDDATAFNAKKRGTIVNKGVMNNAISTSIFQMLEKRGIPTHFVERLSDREMLVKKMEMVPIEVVMRNIAAGSLALRMGVEEGTKLSQPVLEWYYKKDELNDPMINRDHIAAFGLATDADMTTIDAMARKINAILVPFFSERGVDLVDFKLEFGRVDGVIVLGDEISPDGCRLWDAKTHEKLDKDRFRRDLGSIEEAYQRIHKLVVGSEL